MKKGIISLIVIVAVIAITIWGNNGNSEEKPKNEKKTEQVSKPDKSKPAKKKELSDEITYNQKVSQSVNRISYILQDLGGHLTDNQLDSKTWMNDMDKYISDLESAVSDSKKIKPVTKDEKDVDGLYRMGINEMKWITENLPKAVKNNDSDLLFQAVDHLKKGSDDFNAVLSMVN